MDTQISDNRRGGAIRVSDAERDQAVAELGEHYQAGRLTLEEFDERSGVALRAKTGNDLVVLFTDLPTTVVPTAMRPADPVSQQPPADFGGRRAGGPRLARLLAACVIAAIIVGNLTAGFGGPHHPRITWLVPIVVLCLVLLRLARRR
jgi:hypothetical protein